MIEKKKNVLKNVQMSEQYWGCLDKMSGVNFSPAETLYDGGPIIENGGPIFLYKRRNFGR